MVDSKVYSFVLFLGQTIIISRVDWIFFKGNILPIKSLRYNNISTSFLLTRTLNMLLEFLADYLFI